MLSRSLGATRGLTKVPQGERQENCLRRENREEGKCLLLLNSVSQIHDQLQSDEIDEFLVLLQEAKHNLNEKLGTGQVAGGCDWIAVKSVCEQVFAGIHKGSRMQFQGPHLLHPPAFLAAGMSPIVFTSCCH